MKLLWRLEQCIVNAKSEKAKRRLFKYTVNLIMSENTKKIRLIKKETLKTIWKKQFNLDRVAIFKSKLNKFALLIITAPI